MSTDQYKILDTQRKIDKNIRVMNILRFVPIFFIPMNEIIESKINRIIIIITAFSLILFSFSI